MYVCLCNALTDRQLCAAAQSAGGSTARVYHALGVKPKCGQCVPMVRDMVKAAGLAGDPDARF